MAENALQGASVKVYQQQPRGDEGGGIASGLSSQVDGVLKPQARSMVM